MALMWPMGHGDSREGGNPLPPENLDSRLRGSDELAFMALDVVWQYLLPA